MKAYCDPQESIRIEIANNGPAIPPDAAGQIFVPFFTTKEEGSGIGLSLSKQIMRLSGGTLTLLPYKEKGQATVFVLVLIKIKCANVSANYHPVHSAAISKLANYLK